MQPDPVQHSKLDKLMCPMWMHPTTRSGMHDSHKSNITIHDAYTCTICYHYKFELLPATSWTLPFAENNTITMILHYLRVQIPSNGNKSSYTDFKHWMSHSSQVRAVGALIIHALAHEKAYIKKLITAATPYLSDASLASCMHWIYSTSIVNTFSAFQSIWKNWNSIVKEFHWFHSLIMPVLKR